MPVEVFSTTSSFSDQAEFPHEFSDLTLIMTVPRNDRFHVTVTEVPFPLIVPALSGSACHSKEVADGAPPVLKMVKVVQARSTESGPAGVNGVSGNG